MLVGTLPVGALERPQSATTSVPVRGPGPVRMFLVAAALVVAALLGALGAAPTVRADATDDAFVAALRAHGISHESEQAAISAARLVCHQLDMGKSQDEIATDVMNSSGLDGEHAGYFVAVAERAYCPRYADIPA